MNIYQSSEDYLESILAIKERKGVVRSIDIVNELGFSKPSVSIAMKKLRENGYIEMDSSGYITLTDSGLEIADRVYTRHRTIRDLLIHIGVSEAVAAEDACKIEHDVSDETFDILKRCLKKIESES